MTLLLPLLVILVPLLFAVLCAVPGIPAVQRRALPLLPVPALLLALLGGHGWSVELPWLLTGGVWLVDELRRSFLILTALLWLGAGLFATGYLQNRDARPFGILWGLTLAGNLGLVLAGDVAGFYSLFALMTFAGYGLVVHSRSPEAVRAGRVYLIMAVLGEMAMLSALLLAVAAADSLMLADLPAAVASSGQRDLLMTLILLGFGVKAGLPLLHLWLPLAHPVAPTPASAVLSGAMIKAGLLGWLLLLPLGEVALPQWGLALALVGVLASLGGAAIGVCQSRPKAVLAYSSISQMGLMTLMVGVALAEPQRAPVLFPVIALYALHHGLAKGSLFLSCGLPLQRPAMARGWVWLLVALPGLALAGLPLTSGAVSKLAMKQALDPAALTIPWAGWLAPLMSAGAVATLLLVARTLWTLQATTASGPQGVGKSADNKVSPAIWSGWLLVTVSSLLLFWFLPWGLHRTQQPPLWPPLYQWWDLGYPLLIGFTLALLAWRLTFRYPQIPPGDLVVPLERWVCWVVLALNRLVLRVERRQRSAGHPLPGAWPLPALAVLEVVLRSRPALLLLLLLLLAILAGIFL